MDQLFTSDFSDQTIVITGGAGILGGEIACALIACGANIAVLDYQPSRAERIKERLTCGPGRVRILPANVLDKASLIAAREQITAEFGRIDGLINAAGGNHPSATTSKEMSFFDLPVEAIINVVHLNLIGTILACQVFCETMVGQEKGVVINFSSMNALRPLTRIPAYSAAKAAVTNFTQWLAVHLAQEYSPNIRVNAIAPGFFQTTQNEYLLFDENDNSLTQRARSILSNTPVGRFGEPADVIGPVFWLLSQASAFVTGTVIPIDGGFSAFSGI